jgi:hypothetical protein
MFTTLIPQRSTTIASSDADDLIEDSEEEEADDGDLPVNRHRIEVPHVVDYPRDRAFYCFLV